MGSETFHDFNLRGLPSRQKNKYKKYTEVQRCTYVSMNTQIRLFVPLRQLLLTHVYFMLVVNKLDNWEPRVAVVNIVSEARGGDDGELDLELAFFKLSLGGFHFRKMSSCLK
jgi:hypothetical protein